MSRRTKLIITALFLVLLAIPVVYVFWSWRPENPLRFRLVDQRLEKDPFSDEYLKRMDVEVVNTSGATVLFNEGIIFAISPLSGVETDIGSYSGAYQEDDFIPPHTTAQVSFWVQDSGNISIETFGKPLPGPGTMRIEYLWLSRQKGYALAAREWTRSRLPSRWSRWMFRPVFSSRDIMDIDTSPLEITPGLTLGHYRKPEPEPTSPFSDPRH